MEWIQDSDSYVYLQRICSNLEPRDEEELIFKLRLQWLLDVAAEQSSALLNIERAQNSDIGSVPPPHRPKLRLIKS